MGLFYKAKTGNIKLARKRKKKKKKSLPSTAKYRILGLEIYLPCLSPGYNNKQFVKRIAYKGRVFFSYKNYTRISIVHLGTTNVSEWGCFTHFRNIPSR